MPLQSPKTPTSICGLRYARRMASIEARALRDAFTAGKVSSADVANYICMLRRELDEVERLVLGRPSVRRSQRTPCLNGLILAMDRWEYALLTTTMDHVHFTGAGGFPRKQPQSFQGIMNELGALGWEAYEYIPREDETMVAMKRRVE